MNTLKLLESILKKVYVEHNVNIYSRSNSDSTNSYYVDLIPEVNGESRIMNRFDSIQKTIDFVFVLLKKQRLTQKDIFDITVKTASFL